MTENTTTSRTATDRDYGRLYIWDYESLPEGSGIPRERFLYLRLVRRRGNLTLHVALRGVDSNPFEMYDEGAADLYVPCPAREARDFLARVRAEWRARRAVRREAAAENYVRAPWSAYKEWHADHNVAYAGAHEQSAAANRRTKAAADFHPLLGTRREHTPGVWGKTPEKWERFVSFTNPRPGIDVEEYFEFPEYGHGRPVLHTITTVWQKGTRKLRSEAAGAGGYKESHRERELTWGDAAELLRAWTAEAKAQEASKKAAAEAKAATEAYHALWKQFEGSLGVKGLKGFAISTEYGGPHVADSYGNYLFSIPRDIRSYAELLRKLPDMLDDYYANCE